MTTIKAYISLTKPGIVLGNLLTTVGGFALASTLPFGKIFLFTLLGLALVIAAGCVFNNCIDREADKKMERTQKRVLAQKGLPLLHAYVWGGVLLVLGLTLLLATTNGLAFSIALGGFCIYVFLYSFLKYKTSYATQIGSLAGGVPALVGYCSASGALTGGGLLLFAMVALWQMPHFFAISLYRQKEYVSASIPVLPTVKGVRTTQHQIIAYMVGFWISTGLLAFWGGAGLLFFVLSTFLSVFWLGLGLRGFKVATPGAWARQMFLFSLVVITALSLYLLLQKGFLVYFRPL